MTPVILRALRAEIDRLAEAGSKRLATAKRVALLGRRGKAGPAVTISRRLDEALLEEHRARAAYAVLAGAEVPEIPPTFDGSTVMGMAISVDPEQYEDFLTADAVRHRAPREPHAPGGFGEFA